MTDNTTQDDSEYEAIQAALSDLDAYYSNFLRELDDICSTLNKSNNTLNRTA